MTIKQATRTNYPRWNLFSGDAASDGLAVGESYSVFGYGVPAVVTLNNAGGAKVVTQQRSVNTADDWSSIGAEVSENSIHRMVLQDTMEYRWVVITAGTVPVTLHLRLAVPSSFQEAPELLDHIPYHDGFPEDDNGGGSGVIGDPGGLTTWSIPKAQANRFNVTNPFTLGSDGVIYRLNFARSGGLPPDTEIDPILSMGLPNDNWIAVSMGSTPPAPLKVIVVKDNDQEIQLERDHLFIPNAANLFNAPAIPPATATMPAQRIVVPDGSEGDSFRARVFDNGLPIFLEGNVNGDTQGNYQYPQNNNVIYDWVVDTWVPTYTTDGQNALDNGAGLSSAINVTANGTTAMAGGIYYVIPPTAAAGYQGPPDSDNGGARYFARELRLPVGEENDVITVIVHETGTDFPAHINGNVEGETDGVYQYFGNRRVDYVKYNGTWRAIYTQDGSSGGLTDEEKAKLDNALLHYLPSLNSYFEAKLAAGESVYALGSDGLIYKFNGPAPAADPTTTWQTGKWSLKGDYDSKPIVLTGDTTYTLAQMPPAGVAIEYDLRNGSSTLTLPEGLPDEYEIEVNVPRWTDDGAAFSIVVGDGSNEPLVGLNLETLSGGIGTSTGAAGGFTLRFNKARSRWETTQAYTTPVDAYVAPVLVSYTYDTADPFNLKIETTLDPSVLPVDIVRHTLTFRHANQSGRVVVFEGGDVSALPTTITDSAGIINVGMLSGSLDNLTIDNATADIYGGIDSALYVKSTDGTEYNESEVAS